MNKQKFLTEYRAQLKATWPWAADEAKLDRFMASCEATLNGANTWNHDGDTVKATWRAIGGKGKPTLKALRAL